MSDCLESPGIILDRHPDGDRFYSQIAPTLRSQSGGGGSFRVKSPDGSIRPLYPTEYERLMGWQVNSTERGITANGQEITISKCQRQKMLGNGVIPAEIAEICRSLTTILKIAKNTYDKA